MLAWVEYILFGYFLYTVIYSLTFSIAGLFYRLPKFLSTKDVIFNKTAVLIPAYREDGVICTVAEQALSQTYPKEFYDVIIIADSFQQATLDKLRTLNVIVHEVQFEESTKAKSLQHALDTFSGYKIAVVLDADNIMKEDFLAKINLCFNNGWRVIQGKRTAKNRNSSFAILDGLSETIANHINRQGPAALGLSVPLIGSAMAFDFELLRSTMKDINSVVEDKELQVRLLSNKEKIHYVTNAIVLDEKVSNPEVFKNQRKRWVAGQYHHFKDAFVNSFRELFRGNFSLFNITVLFNVQLPRVLSIGLLGVLTLLSIIFQQSLFLPFWYWCILLGTYITSFLLAIPISYYDKSFFKAVLQAPKAFFIIFSLHFQLKGAQKKFIHTPHKH